MTQTFAVIDSIMEMAAKKSSKFGKFRSFGHFLFLLKKSKVQFENYIERHVDLCSAAWETISLMHGIITVTPRVYSLVSVCITWTFIQDKTNRKNCL